MREAAETHSADGCREPLPILGLEPARQAEATPQPGRHHVLDRDGEAPIDGCALRQIGHATAVDAVQPHAPRQGAEEADNALGERRLAATVRPDDREERAPPDFTVQMVHGRMPVVAERQVLERYDRRHSNSRKGHLIRALPTTASSAERPPHGQPKCCERGGDQGEPRGGTQLPEAPPAFPRANPP